MEGFPVVLIVILAVALFIGLAIWGHIAAKKRREALQALAGRWGFRFSPSDPLAISSRHGAHGALAQGSNRYAYNVLDGDRKGRRCVGFDYHYETYSRDSKGRRRTHHHRFSALLVEPGARFPLILIRPENIFDKMAEFVGFDDIDFESAEFSRKFFVKSDDRKRAYDLLHARAMEYLLREGADMALEFRGETVLVSDGKTWSPERFEAAAARIEGLLELVPDFLWQDLGGRGVRRDV